MKVMKGLCYGRMALLCAIFLSLVLSANSIEELYLKVGEKDDRRVLISNPAENLNDRLKLSIKTTDNVNIFIMDPSLEEMTELIFDIEPKGERIIPIKIIPGICAKKRCEGEATFKVESLITNNFAEKSIKIFISPEEPFKVVGSAPDLTFYSVILIIMLATALKLFKIM